MLRIAGERFVLMNEWDECSLISTSEAGDAILRAVFVGQRPRRPARDHRVVARQFRGLEYAMDRL